MIPSLKKNSLTASDDFQTELNFPDKKFQCTVSKKSDSFSRKNFFSSQKISDAFSKIKFLLSQKILIRFQKNSDAFSKKIFLPSQKNSFRLKKFRCIFQKNLSPIFEKFQTEFSAKKFSEARKKIPYLAPEKNPSRKIFCKKKSGKRKRTTDLE